MHLIHSHTTANNSKIKNSTFFQPKLSINQPGDTHEQEADAVADKVMRMTEPSSQKLFFSSSIVQRKCDQCEEEEMKAQRKEDGNQTAEASPQTENYINSLSGGKSLNDNERSFFEKGIGHDFSNVRLHTDHSANESAKNLHALAYTSGNNIVFASNQYQPETSAGKKLLAHELTHVVQQSADLSRKIQTKRELDSSTEKDTYTKCLAAIGNVITKLEANAGAKGMPDDVKEAITLLRTKFTEKKIKCYYLDGNTKGETNFTTGEIYMDAKFLDGTTDIFANIGEGTVLHEGTHALHNQKFPGQTKKYGKALDNKHAGKANNLTPAEEKDMQRLDAYTEYWAYRKVQEYNNAKSGITKTDEELHSATLKDMKSRPGAMAPLNTVWAFDPKFDPRKWKPKN